MFPVVSAHIEMAPAVICALPVVSTMTLWPEGQFAPSESIATYPGVPVEVFVVT